MSGVCATFVSCPADLIGGRGTVGQEKHRSDGDFAKICDAEKRIMCRPEQCNCMRRGAEFLCALLRKVGLEEPVIFERIEEAVCRGDRAFLCLSLRIAPFLQRVEAVCEVDFRDTRGGHDLTKASFSERVWCRGVGVHNADCARIYGADCVKMGHDIRPRYISDRAAFNILGLGFFVRKPFDTSDLQGVCKVDVLLQRACFHHVVKHS